MPQFAGSETSGEVVGGGGCVVEPARRSAVLRPHQINTVTFFVSNASDVFCKTEIVDCGYADMSKTFQIKSLFNGINPIQFLIFTGLMVFSNQSGAATCGIWSCIHLGD